MHLHGFAGNHHSLLPNNLALAWHEMQCKRYKRGASVHRIKRIPTQDVKIRSVGGCSNKNLFYSMSSSCKCQANVYVLYTHLSDANTLWSGHLSDASSLLSFPLICTRVCLSPHDTRSNVPTNHTWSKQSISFGLYVARIYCHKSAQMRFLDTLVDVLYTIELQDARWTEHIIFTI